MSQADTPNTSANHAAQDLHAQHYDTFLHAIAVMRYLNQDDAASDDRRDRAHSAIDEALEALMECPPSSLEHVLLKVRAAQHNAINSTEGSVVSPRVYGELLGIIAADLEIVMQIADLSREG